MTKKVCILLSNLLEEARALKHNRDARASLKRKVPGASRKIRARMKANGCKKGR